MPKSVTNGELDKVSPDAKEVLVQDIREFGPTATKQAEEPPRG